MALTVSTSGLRAQIWLKELMADVKDQLFFDKKEMIGEGSNNIVERKLDLMKQHGDRVIFGLTTKLSGAGITGDSTLEGNEEAISSYSQSCIIDYIRNGVRATGRLDEQKVMYDMREDAREQLAKFIAEYLERQIFMKLGGVTTLTLTDVNSVTYSGSATWSNSAAIVPAGDEAAGTGARYICKNTGGLDALTASDKFTTDLITKAKTKAMLASPKIQPLRIDGQDFYVMFVHPWQAADLKTNTSDVWAQAQREANVRGEKNPIFSGALGVWDGVILHAHEYVPTAQATVAFGVGGTAVPASVRAFRALLCGRQAAVFAECKKTYNEELFDYGNSLGISAGLMGGVQKSNFNSKDYGVIAVDTSATSLA